MSAMSIPFLMFVIFMTTIHEKDSFASAHTVLYRPLAWNPIHCSPPNCWGPIPGEWTKGQYKARNSANRPAETWKRGQYVKIQWHRNNHSGGFVRFSLVPVSKKNDRRWHAYTAFHYGCFSGQVYKCKGTRACGNDNLGRGYYQYIEVPRVFPDGNYVFTMVWFGGLRVKDVKDEFPNFFSASYVRIRGGKSVWKYHNPKFFPVKSSFNRDGEVNAPYGTCLTAASWVGECRRGQACRGRKAVATVPGIFKNGLRPEVIHAKKIKMALSRR